METFVSELLENADLGVITKKDVRLQYKHFLGRDISAEEKAKINDLVYSFVFYHASRQKKFAESTQESGVTSIGGKENKLKNQSKFIKGHVTDKNITKNLMKKKHHPDKSPEYVEDDGHNIRMEGGQRKVYPMRKRSLSSKIQLAEAVTAIQVSESESERSSSEGSDSDSESDFDRNDENLQLAMKRLQHAREIKIQMSLARKLKKRAERDGEKKVGGLKDTESKSALIHNGDTKNSKQFLHEINSNNKMYKPLGGVKKRALGSCERVRSYNVSEKSAKQIIREKNRALNGTEQYRKHLSGDKNAKSHLGVKANQQVMGLKKEAPIVISSSEESVLLLSDLYSPQKVEEENNPTKNTGQVSQSQKNSAINGTNSHVVKNVIGKIPSFRKKTSMEGANSNEVKKRDKTFQNQKKLNDDHKSEQVVTKPTVLPGTDNGVENRSGNPDSNSKSFLASNSEVSQLESVDPCHSNRKTGAITITSSQTEDSGPLDVKKTPVTYSIPKAVQRSSVKNRNVTVKQILKRKKRLETDSESETEGPVNKKNKPLKGIKLQNRFKSRNEIMKLVKKKREAAALEKLSKEKKEKDVKTDKGDLLDGHKDLQSSSIGPERHEHNPGMSDGRTLTHDRVHALRESSSDIVSSEMTDNVHESDSLTSSQGTSLISEYGDSPPPLETDTDSSGALVIDMENSPVARISETDSPLQTTPGQLRKKKMRQVVLTSDDDSPKKVHAKKKSRLVSNAKTQNDPGIKHGYKRPDEFVTIGEKSNMNKNGVIVLSEDSDEDEPLSLVKSKMCGVKTKSSTADVTSCHSTPETSCQSTPKTTPLNTSLTTPLNSSLTSLSSAHSTPQSSTKLGEECEYLQELRKICKASGIYIRTNRHLKGCNTDEEKIAALREVLEDAGMEGEPSMKKGDELRLKREAGDFNTANIISSEGRGRRNVRSLYSRPKDQDSLSETPEKRDTELLDRLKEVVGSDTDSE